MMIHAAMRKAETPWWAAIGAPLVGVPLLVGLLSLTAPEPVAPVADAVVSVQQAQSAFDCEDGASADDVEPIWKS